jgi:hypothetical protein
MATLPSARLACALTVALALVGVMLVGPDPLNDSAGRASASALVEAPAFKVPPPPPPDTDAPQNPVPTQAAPPAHRRHIDGDPVLQR